LQLNAVLFNFLILSNNPGKDWSNDAKNAAFITFENTFKYKNSHFEL